jgi:hypothetical protein
MFGHSDGRRRHSGGIIQMFLSLIILTVLGIGLYLAYRNFSGYDPLKLSPESLVKALSSSTEAEKLIKALLTVSPGKSLNLGDKSSSSNSLNSQNTPSQHSGQVKFKFAVVADSHKDYDNLGKALNQAKNGGANFIVGMGDFSDVGTNDELLNTKKQFDAVGLPYYVTAGDHDLWDARNQKLSAETNFRNVFGAPYQSFAYQGARFIVFYNSDNYVGLDSVQLQWLEDQVNRSKTEQPKPFFVFASTPLYHPSSDHVMGKVTPKLKDQADHMLSIFSKVGVDEAFFADTHYYSRYSDPVTNLKITTVGAITSDRNPQTPRFAMVDVYTDGSYNVTETEVK